MEILEPPGRPCNFVINDSPTFSGWYLGQWGSGEFANVAVTPETLAMIRAWSGTAGDDFEMVERRDGLCWLVDDYPITIKDAYGR